MFAKLIRDADKIDILYESVYIFYKNNEDMVNKSILSEKIYNEFMKKSSIKKEKNVILKYIDDIVCVLALIFDINYKPSFEILKKENYIFEILNRYNFDDELTKKRVKSIELITNEYIDTKIK